MQKNTPDWLKPIIKLEDFNGDVHKYIEHIFSIFEQDFILNKPIFNKEKVFHNKSDSGGKPACFVHITTEENKETGERELSLRRCERLSWIKAVIENSDDLAVLVWKKEQNTNKRFDTRIYLFLHEEDFLVILQPQKKYGHYMITAIYVDNPNQKRKHLKSYSEFQKRNQTI